MNATNNRPTHYVVASCWDKGNWEYFAMFDTLKQARSGASALRKNTKFETMIYKGCLGGELVPN